MYKFNITIAAIALIALCSCSGQSSLDSLNARETADVTSIIDGWNANCLQHNFRFAYEEMTLGDHYMGSDFDTDMDAMEEALADYYGIPREDINGESAMGFVHFDDETVD